MALSIGVTVYGWWLSQTIYQTTYANKAGVDYWATWSLRNNLFSAAILLTLLSMITLPQRSTFITFISALSSSSTSSSTTRLDFHGAVIWRLFEAVAFFGFYLSIGGYSLTGQNVAFLMMLMGDGSISVSASQLSTMFSLPFIPNVAAQTVVDLVPAMEAYQLYLGLISTFIVVTGGRFALTFAAEMMKPRRDFYVVISKGLIVGAFLIILELLSVPMWTVNAGTWMTYLSLILALAGCVIGSILFTAMRVRAGPIAQRLRSKISSLEEDYARLQGELISVRQEYETGAMDAEDYTHRVNLLMQDRRFIADELRRLKMEQLMPLRGYPRRYTALVVVLIVMVTMLPIIQAAYYGIQMSGDKYIDWKFNYETKKEIAITNWAAGLQGMEELTLEDLTSNATPKSEVEFLTTVRQWDQTASYLRMKNQIGTNWMQLADSDIVYLGGHEYWMAPLTFDYNTISTNFINQHLYYTHTEGLVILDAYSGDIIEHTDLVALLNRSSPINFYYGEGHGFDDVAFVNVPGFEEVGNYSFTGVPDYTLRGFESTFYIMSMGPEAWSFMGRDMDMLVSRNIQDRVQSILLQGLKTDSDPYIVVDTTGGIYYAVSVYIDYPLATGYAHESYLRFLGVVLVGIEDGDLSFYKAPSENETSFFIDQTYMNYYPWQEAPQWLKSQMKWPEDLYERQLDVAYIYHVTDGFDFKSGVDFHEAPSGSDTRYIIMRIAGQDRFVAMHNAEFRDSAGRNLAGLYVMGCGAKKFGELAFYGSGHVGMSTLLGPSAAVQAFETNEEVRTQLQLWGAHRYGNRLLYHLGGDLFYVIPVFLEVETSTNRVIEKLGGVGLVDAETGERVQLGANVVEAYYKMFGLLNQTVVETGEVGIESLQFNPVTINSGEFSSLDLMLRNNDNVSHHLYVDITVATGNFSIFWHGSSISPTVNAQNTTFVLDIGTVGVGDVYGTSPQVTALLHPGLVLATYLVVVTLRTENGIVDQQTLLLTVT
ncbi:MAG: UPF0182 family protein [Candidatus Thorarchaeota archaeon]